MKNIKYIFPVLLLICCSFVFSDTDTSQSDTDISQQLKTGIMYLNSNKTDKAIEYFQEMTNEAPSNSMVYLYLGEAYQKKGDIQKAQENYGKSIQADASNVTAHYNFGLIYIMEGNGDKAVEEFTTVKKIEPGSLLAKKADKEIKTITSASESKQMLKEWKTEEAANEQVSSETGITEQQGPMPSAFPGAPGKTPGAPGMETHAAIPTETIAETIKDLKFSMLSKRKETSKNLFLYSKDDLTKYLQVLITLVDKEKDLEIRKNILVAIGMTTTQDAGNFLLDFLKRGDESFDCKIVALRVLEDTTNPDVADKLKNTLAQRDFSFQQLSTGGQTPQTQQEQIFALTLINILGKIGKPDYLDTIQSAWSDYGNESFQIRYYLALARLGNYDYIDTLVDRLKDDYPQGASNNTDMFNEFLREDYPPDALLSLSEEVNLRTGIVNVLGDYLSTNKNDDYKDFLQYLSASDPAVEVKRAANKALSKIK